MKSPTHSSTFCEKGCNKLDTSFDQFGSWLKVDRKRPHIGGIGVVSSWNTLLKKWVSKDEETMPTIENEPERGTKNVRDMQSGDGMANMEHMGERARGDLRINR